VWEKPHRQILFVMPLRLAPHATFQAPCCHREPHIVAGGGQDFVRVYPSKTYGIPPERVVGTAGGTSFGYDKSGRTFLTKEPQLLRNDDHAGKPGEDVIKTAFGPNLPPLGAIKRNYDPMKFFRVNHNLKSV
jgi:Berberine and berberine like